MLLSYSTLFSRVLGRIYDPKELSLSKEDLNELYIERLHNVIGNSRVSNIFNLLVLHEVEQESYEDSDASDDKNIVNSNEEPDTEDTNPVYTENTIEYELKNFTDELSDNEYVIQILMTGMVIEWLRPKVDSVLYTAPMIGEKEEKKILDGHKDMIGRLEQLENQLHKLIRDRGYIHNSYIETDGMV